MTVNHAIDRLFVLLAFSLVLGVAACGGSDEASEPPPDTDDDTYKTEDFVLPFEVTVPTWLPATQASVDQANFVTWEPDSLAEPAVRFLAPVTVFPPFSVSAPGENRPIPPPVDYVDYLLAQREIGATFADVTESTVDGRPATFVTATADAPLDGSLGCPAEGLPAGDCFGLQPNLALRIAVIDVGERPLLAWLRLDSAVSAGEATSTISSFEEMLTSLRFGDPGSASEEPAPEAAAASSPIDGVWSTRITHEQLESSPLLLDADEVNDQNWGDLTFTIDDGTFSLTIENPRDGWKANGEFEVDGSTLRLELTNGEQFAMRWSVDGDELTLTRDEQLGIAPTPFVLQPWERQA